MLYPVSNKFRSLMTLDGYWEFCTDKEGVGENEGWHNGFENSRTIAVPASINEQYEDLFNYFGKCWFEKTFELPDSYKDKSVYLRFGSVTGKTTVWVNGEKVCCHEGGSLPFECEISGFLKFDEKNIVVVLSDNTLDPWALPPAALVTNEGREGFFRSYPQTTYDFFPYSGIHRSVYIYSTSRVRIEDITVKTDITADNGARVKCTVKMSEKVRGEVCLRTNGSEIKHTLDDECEFEGEFTVDNPRLWDIGQPNLYELEAELVSDDGECDKYSLSYGIREVKVENNKILLNGKEIFLKGFGKHEDFHVLGKGFNHALAVKDFSLMNWVGANSFRTSHYPYDESIMDIADRNGVLVIDETPLVGLNKRMYTDDVLSRSKKLVADLIDRDKNHPSVIMWSLANEPDARSEEGEEYFKELVTFARGLDKTRPFTYVAYMEPEDNEALKYYDVVCINKYYGWYLYPGEIDAGMEEFGECLDNFHKKFNKPIVLTEFGAESIPGLHAMPSQTFTEEYQSELLLKTLDTLKEKPFVVGAHIWAFCDFQVGQSTTRIMYNRKGIFTRDRHPKASAYDIRKYWTQND